MINPHITRRTIRIIAILILVILAAYIIYRIIPPTERHIQECQVNIEQRSHYELEVDNRAVAYFADYADSTFTGGSTKKDSIVSRRIYLKGYWVNRLNFLPSCFGRIVTQWRGRPSGIVNLKSDKLHGILRKIFIKIDNELGGLEAQHNELRYYLRIHNVQDYGYNSNAAYEQTVVHRMDSLAKLIKVLRAIKPGNKLRVRQINNYFVGKESCNRLAIYPSAGAILLQTQHKRTPLRIHTRLMPSDALELLKKLSSTTERCSMLAEMSLNAIADSAGFYIGETKGGKPEGYGQRYGRNGSYYEGHWVKGMRDGFGFYIAPYEYLQAGEWKANVFKGERLTYTAERIYGIDISRHQHEQKGKLYDINWDKLRITHLGTLSNKKIKGRVDYPVSFIYIKSTEGCTVLNAYYATDYKQARVHGVRTGTYHFFSTISPGAAQAEFFLRNSMLSKGDMPPVLDVEPTDWQIKHMGGPEVLFRSVRAWMEKVTKRTGCRPVLYISQSFTKKYLPLAPDLADNYLVWIARYGEYKPDIKLAYWQLSPDGRISGIHGDVDINVFNGYENQYHNFLKKHCVK